MNFFRSLYLLSKHNSYFFIPFIILFLFGFTQSLLEQKGESVIIINSLHTPILDEIMVFFSFLGDGSIFVIGLLIAGFFNFKYLFKGGLTYLTTFLVSAILKNLFDRLRPIKVLTDVQNIHFVEGVRINSYLSFPSGHTTSAFSMMMFLCLITPNKNLKLIYCILATLIGVSRMYLFQHFLEDVLLGSLIGVFFTLLIIHYIYQNDKILNSNWYNYSFYRTKFKKNE